MPGPSRLGGVLTAWLLCGLFVESVAAQDLSLQVNFIQGERLRGDTIDVAFVVANPTTEAVTGYRVDFFASRDEALDDDDILLGAFQSTERFRDNAFQENRITLETCSLALDTWRIFGRLEDIQPSDSDPGNNVALASGVLILNQDDDDPATCPELAADAGIINPGLNDAWFNPDTVGQGFFINVFGDTGNVFLAWFTFDTSAASSDRPAVLGDAGHRWLTAFGNFEGSRATLEVTNTRGGRFDQGEPSPINEPYGTLTLSFENCGVGALTYDLPGAGVSGAIPIQRVVPDNRALCETLASARSSDSH